ncbi:hypothetical protein TL5118_01353 [Thalassovita autumnalis]|uniref:Uncharacterized protein n=1 Tax=Thalassovita autumnalis TaxID=2072972 RepID=A0A0P1FBJ1_9RHOB|nr:hypothetical protein [Thalassovita autumnalis]CUH65544.1 hypothetical protein TL5118_01353 [Thalassovita autumnalis]CUH70557.1 hypothetical protein TL5120_00334 [Thalassovita autumnalis]
MPAEFEIFLDHNLVYARYQGAIVVEEISTLMLRYRSHVDYSPHQRQLIDLSRVTLVKLEMPAFLAIQQQVLQAQNLHAPTTRLVFFAPNALSQDIAANLQSFWAPFPSVRVSIAETAEEAMQHLSLKAQQIQALMQTPPHLKSAE